MLAPKPGVVIALGACIPALVLSMLTLRFISKSRSYRQASRPRRLGIDDYMIILPSLLLITLCGLLIAGTVQHGYGYQSDTRTAEQGFMDQSEVLKRTKFYTNFHNWFFPMVFGLTKISVLFFYRHIFRGFAFDVASWTLVAICAVWTLTTFFFSIFQCGVHVNYLADSAAQIAGSCLSGYAIALPVAITDVLTDLMILTLPLFWVWRLRMSFWRKMAVCAMFMFGSLALASSATRLAMFALVFPHHNTAADQLAYLTTVAYWVDLEGGLCITAACLPTLAPLLPRSKRTGSSTSATLSHYLERGWCALTRKDPPRRPSVYTGQLGSGSTKSSARDTYRGGLGTFASPKRTQSQSDASGTEELVGNTACAHSSPLDDIELSSRGAKEGYWDEMEHGNVVVTKDISVEHHTIGNAI